MKQVRYELQVAIFISVGLFLFVGSLLIMGKERRLFASKVYYYSFFKDIKGLHAGSPIRLGGITIGQVSDIEFDETKPDLAVKVSLEIDEQFSNLIHNDSKTQIGSQGLLGDSLMKLISGDPQSGVAPPNSIIQVAPSVELAEVSGRVTDVVASATELFERIERISAKFEKNDFEKVEHILSHIETFTESLHSGNGLLPALLGSQELKTQSTTLLDSISDITKEIKKGDGLINALVYQKGGKKTVRSVEEAVGHLSAAAAQIRDIADTVSNPDGAVGQFFLGGDETKSLIANLSDAAKNLEEITASIRTGQGTLGALIMDSSLYDNAVEITGTAKRSVILKEAIRHTVD